MSNSIQFGEDFELDVLAYELRSGGTPLKLKPIAMELMLFLIERRGQLVTREQIVERIWGKNVFLDFDNSINSAVNSIRRVLRDDPERPRFVQTVARKGYRFIARVYAVTPETRIPQPLQKKSNNSPPGIHAIAVLPLEDLSGAGGQDYFADSMTEALITTLSKIKALRVISRTTAMQYRGARKSLPQIASELKVDAVIEGSILRSGERIRINVQLIDAVRDQHLWAENYERNYRDILSLQNEIARQAANEIRTAISPEEWANLRSARTIHPEAHEWYLKARHHWNKRKPESVTKALSYFHKAIDIDPIYAQAYAGLADCYNILAYYNALAPIEAYPKAKAAAIKALDLDKSLAEPHAALGVVNRDFEWNWSKSKQEFRLAVELNPGYVEAHHWRSTLLSMLGQHVEAVREKTRALEMDPLSVVIRTDLGRMFYFSRDYDQALDQYRAALDLDESFIFAHLWLAQVYQQKGIFEDAISELRTGLDLSDDGTYGLARLGHGYALLGQVDEARSVLQRLNAASKQKYVSPYDVALVHVGLQQKDEAFDWLQKAFQQRSLWLGYLNVEPQLDSLRSDPRFQKLLGSVGLLKLNTAQRS
jgi:TolB-like protein/Tfp pilus assembly protein PilF